MVGRSGLRARLALAGAGGLLTFYAGAGCGINTEFVRQGISIDSIAAGVNRIETQQQLRDEELRRLRAEILTELQTIQSRINQLEARTVDQDERLARIGRKLGVWQGTLLTPDTASATESLPAASDTVDVVSVVDPDQLYSTAYLDFTRGKYRVALAGFKQYLQMFPATDLADNAQYWIGEAYYSLGELTNAEEEFRRVLTAHPAGNKVPAAIYKLGLVYQSQGKTEEARRQFQFVVDKYPGTTEAELAQERLSR